MYVWTLNFVQFIVGFSFFLSIASLIGVFILVAISVTKQLQVPYTNLQYITDVIFICRE